MADADDANTDDVVEEGLTQEVENALASDIGGALVPNSDTDLTLSGGDEDEEAETADEQAEADEGTGEDKEGAEDEKSTDAEESKETDTVTAPAAEPEEKPEADPSGVYNPATTTDPGDFQPADYSFEIKTTDGKTHKITTPEDGEAFANTLDENPESISASQFTKLGSKLAVMEQGIAADKREYDANKAVFDQQAEVAAGRDNMVKQVNNGFNYLQSQGKLPAIPAELNTADIKWEDHKDNEAIKERLDLLDYMNKDNEQRIANGLEPSFDVTAAFNAVKLEAMQTTATKTEKKELKDRQKRGSMVGRQANYTPGNPQSGKIVGTGGSLSDLVNEFQFQ